jgi:hypothetical protein
MSDATEAPRALTPRELLFVECVVGGDPYAVAARRCGYAEKNSRHQGADMARRPHVRAAIDAGFAEKAREAGHTAARVQLELAAVGYAHPGLYDVDQATGAVTVKPGIPAHYLGAVAGVRAVRGPKGRVLVVALHEKNTALRNAGVNLGMFVERTATAETTLDALLREAASDGDGEP